MLVSYYHLLLCQVEKVEKAKKKGFCCIFELVLSFDCWPRYKMAQKRKLCEHEVSDKVEDENATVHVMVVEVAIACQDEQKQSGS